MVEMSNIMYGGGIALCSIIIIVCVISIFMLKKKEKTRVATESTATQNAPQKLNNKNNVCYINSAIQCLFNLNAFVDLILNNECNGKIYSELKNVFLTMKNAKSRSCDLTKLLKLLIEKNNKFIVGNQEDVHEFIVALINELKSEIEKNGLNQNGSYIIDTDNKENEEPNIINNKVTHTIDELFYTKIEEKRERIKCGHFTIKKDEYFGLAYLPNENIQRTIEKQNETVESKCEICSVDDNKNMPTTVSQTITQCPKYFMITLQRNIGQRNKNRNGIDIDKTVQLDGKGYNINSFIEHSGSTNRGHYICYVNKNSEWFVCNDEEIAFADTKKIETVLSTNSNVYILFYEKLN